ncbi:hypothetical protein AtNW77_Chr3g0165031 [Arabidopsis thaliana]|uniref:F-box domain-containing protein n=2 Tax=Arabidopsis TaxID=3701 RepID=A0A178VE85_ARATH|nr:hypothetical protein ISN45_At03g009330 [Arabidopsis thaliana x Arabidopsis arenosa]OAP04104.1 hypothetical protein AXX17_AT3G09420 [Arabidopsis thaliana]
MSLSLVSKSFRSLLASPELYKVRSQLGRTESCLYVCFDMENGLNWFTLCRKPDKTITGKESGYALARVPIPHSPNVRFSSLVRLALISTTMGFPVELYDASAGVLYGKIDVAGNSPDRNSMTKSVEVFKLDIKTQVWDPEPIHCRETKYHYMEARRDRKLW